MKVAPNLSKLPVQTATTTTTKDTHKMKLCKDWITTLHTEKENIPQYSKLKDTIAAVKTMKEDREQLKLFKTHFKFNILKKQSRYFSLKIKNQVWENKGESAMLSKSLINSKRTDDPFL